MLYQSESLADINVGRYLTTLAGHLITSSGLTDGPVILKDDIETMSLGLETVSDPMGFIITELVANSVRHAFPDGRGGEIRISPATCGRGAS